MSHKSKTCLTYSRNTHSSEMITVKPSVCVSVVVYAIHTNLASKPLLLGLSFCLIGWTSCKSHPSLTQTVCDWWMLRMGECDWLSRGSISQYRDKSHYFTPCCCVIGGWKRWNLIGWTVHGPLHVIGGCLRRWHLASDCRAGLSLATQLTKHMIDRCDGQWNPIGNCMGGWAGFTRQVTLDEVPIND